MKPTWLYRIAALLLVLFATAHTVGFLKFIPPTPEGRAVMDGMNTVSLLPGSVYTYGSFYRPGLDSSSPRTCSLVRISPGI